MGTHEATNLKHNRPKLLIVAGNRGILLQVKQAGLMLQGMVQIMELGFQCLAEILPGTYPKFGPISLATDLHHVEAFPVSRVTAILTTSVVCITPATSQNY